MKKAIKNLIGLVLSGILYYLAVLPLIVGEKIGLPNNGKLVGAMLMWVIGLPLVSFLLPGIITFVVYKKNKTGWSYFYGTGWIIYLLMLMFVSLIMYRLKFMD